MRFGVPLSAILLAFFAGAIATQASDCTRTAVGFVPIDELGAASYRGLMGGLYPGGMNKRPSAHQAAGLRLAAEVVPRNPAGALDSQNGRVVLLSVGMSNTTQEFQMFKAKADPDPEKNPRLIIVDGAQGGWSADRIVAGGEEYWASVENRLRAAGVTAAQVQVAWMKQADASPRLPFPEDARRLQGELQTLAQTLRTRFPNLRLLYLSSRIYAGYASTQLNPEPFAYQSAFAVKWLIEGQIQGDPELSFDAGRVPWMAWGPYLWADGVRGRSDGLSWRCSDFQEDGTHPATTAREKVAALLLDFLKTDPTARPWFLRLPPCILVPSITARPLALLNAASFQPAVAARSIATLFLSIMPCAPWNAQASELPLPLRLGDIRVEIDGILVPLLYVSCSQINLGIPPTATGGTLLVKHSCFQSDPWTVTLSAAAPALFTLGDAAGSAAAVHADGRLVSAQAPARRGETIMLFGTGLGAVDPATGIKTAPPPVVRVGGREAAITYAGAAPGFPSLDQINVTIPADALTGPAVRVDVQVGAAAAAPVVLPVGM